MENAENILQFIINTPFDGTIHTSVSNGTVHYSELSVEEYLDSKLGARLITLEQLQLEEEKYWTTTFKECTEEQWWDYYEQLPPVKPRTINKRYFVDHCSEAMSGTFHSLYLHDRLEDKFYTCLLCINSSDDHIVEKFNREVLDS